MFEGWNKKASSPHTLFEVGKGRSNVFKALLLSYTGTVICSIFIVKVFMSGVRR